MKTKLVNHFVFFLVVSLIVYLSGGSGCKKVATKTDCDKVITVGPQNLNAITFVDPHKGIAVGNGGTVTSTSNGGNTWLAPVSITPTPKNLYGIGAATPLIIIAVGEDATVMRSTNRGNSWFPITVNSLQTLRTVAFYSATEGYAAGDSGVVFFTSDAGANWTKVHGNSTHAYYGLSYNSQDTLFIVGKAGIVLTGSAFTESTPTTKNLRSIHFALRPIFNSHADTGFIVGDSGIVLKTSNGGINWINEPYVTVKNLRSVFLTSTNWGYAVGESGTVLRYSGIWTQVPIATTENLNGVDDATLSSTDYCVGDNGAVGTLCPPPVPSASNTVTPELVSTTCEKWEFLLVMTSLSDVDESGGPFNYVRFKANSSVGVSVGTMPSSGWAMHESSPYFGLSLPLGGSPINLPDPDGFKFKQYTCSPSTGELVWVTCVLIDNVGAGRPWLLGKYVCTP